MRNQAILDLPFVASMGSVVTDYWATPPESGDWAADNWTGRSYADGLFAACTDGELGMVLSHVANAITARGEYGGIEVGFFNRLGEIASGASGTAAMRKAA